MTLVGQPALCETDYAFLHWVASAYVAVSTVSTDAVVVPASPPLRERRVRAPLSHVYYDCSDDEAEAVKIVQARVHIHRRTIEQQLDSLTELQERFVATHKALRENDRTRVHREVCSIRNTLALYGPLVSHHQGPSELCHRSETFLEYPFCPEGHFFVVPHYPIIAPLNFNTKRTAECFLISLGNFTPLALRFRAGEGDISFVTLNEADITTEAGGSTLLGKLAITKRLLQKVGY